MARADDVPCQRALQLTGRVTGAARSHKDEVGLQQRLKNFGIIRAELRPFFAGGDQVYGGFVILQAGLEEVTYTPSHERGV
jgi:hypothetical protein